jgi:hypothetical protein
MTLSTIVTALPRRAGNVRWRTYSGFSAAATASRRIRVSSMSWATETGTAVREATVAVPVYALGRCRDRCWRARRSLRSTDCPRGWTARWLLVLFVRSAQASQHHSAHIPMWLIVRPFCFACLRILVVSSSEKMCSSRRGASGPPGASRDLYGWLRCGNASARVTQARR